VSEGSKLSDGVRVTACRASELVAAEVRVVPLARGVAGQPREAIVLFDEHGELRAYRNLCNHLPVPLDAASRRFLKDGSLQCATHGARYRLHDGYCFAGPCKGASLRPLRIERDGEHIVLIDLGDG
jgi:nitrite reductase/ring-hydroxylating ferredoxin subunit